MPGSVGDVTLTAQPVADDTSLAPRVGGLAEHLISMWFMVKSLDSGVAVVVGHERDESRSPCLAGCQNPSLPARLTSDWGSIRSVKIGVRGLPGPSFIGSVPSYDTSTAGIPVAMFSICVSSQRSAAPYRVIAVRPLTITD